MQKPAIKVSVDQDICDTLEAAGKEFGGITPNMILAIAGYEIARAVRGKPQNLWHVLGRIAGEEGLALMPSSAGMLPAPPERAKRVAGVRG